MHRQLYKINTNTIYMTNIKTHPLIYCQFCILINAKKMHRIKKKVINKRFVIFIIIIAYIIIDKDLLRNIMKSSIRGVGGFCKYFATHK